MSREALALLLAAARKIAPKHNSLLTKPAPVK
jgi:hypothetical protein